jgi:hypothetical protein
MEICLLLSSIWHTKTQQKGENWDNRTQFIRRSLPPTTQLLSTVSMQQVTFKVSCQWTVILIVAVMVIPLVLLLTLRSPRILSTCHRVTFNSTTYHRLCDAPVEDHILLFCIVSSRCNTHYNNMSEATLHEENTCMSLDYRMDCNRPTYIFGGNLNFFFHFAGKINKKFPCF